MYTRNYSTALLAPQQQSQSWLGDAVDDAASSSDPTQAQLHAVALQILAQRNLANAQLANVSNADGEVDWDALNTALQNIVSLQAQLRTLSAQWNAQSGSMYGLNPFDQAFLAVGAWAQGVLDAIPDAVSALPNAIVNGLGKIASNTGSALTSAVVPWVVGGGLVLFLVLQAEKSRTYRKVVA